MKLSERLKSPTGLVLQGFAAGAFLFFAAPPLSDEGAAPAPPAAEESVLDTLRA